MLSRFWLSRIVNWFILPKFAHDTCADTFFLCIHASVRIDSWHELAHPWLRRWWNAICVMRVCAIATAISYCINKVSNWTEKSEVPSCRHRCRQARDAMKNRFSTRSWYTSRNRFSTKSWNTTKNRFLAVCRISELRLFSQEQNVSELTIRTFSWIDSALVCSYLLLVLGGCHQPITAATISSAEARASVRAQCTRFRSPRLFWQALESRPGFAHSPAVVEAVDSCRGMFASSCKLRWEFGSISPLE